MRRGFLLVPSAERKTTRPAADRTAVVASIDKKSKVTQDASSRCKPVTKDQLSKSKPISINYDTTIVIQDNPLILLSNNIPGSPYFGYFPPGSAEPELVLVHNGLETVKRAANWPVWKTTSQSAYVLDQKSDTFKIVPVEGKGFGMVAARTIRAGELICQERPIYAASDQLLVPNPMTIWNGTFHRNALSRLTVAQQEAFMSLRNAFSDTRDTVPGILSTNNLQGDEGPRMFTHSIALCVCFATLSRANHSCTPCANYFFDFKSFSGRFYASREIQAGEEITIMYTELDDTQQNRKSKLWMSYRFDCTCEACRMPADGRELSDKRRLYIRNALRQLDSFDSDLSFEDLELAIKYAKSEGLAAYKSKLLLLGSSHIIKTAFTSRDKLGTYLKGRKMLEEAAAMSAMLEGTDSWTFQSIKLALDESFGPGMVPGR